MSADNPNPVDDPPINDAAINDAARPIEQTFDAVPDAVPQARQFLDTWLAECGLDGADLRIAVSELVTNAVRHGQGPIRLTMAAFSDRVRVEVHDCGGGHPAIRSIQIIGPQAGGWGLRMVDELVDRWGVDNAGDLTTVWVEQLRPQHDP